MARGESLAEESQFTILHKELPAPDEPDTDLSPHQYTVGSTSGDSLTHVVITPYALQQGDEAYSGVRVSQTRGSSNSLNNLQTTVETYVHPPLMTEAEREAAALRVSQMAVAVALDNLR